MENLLLAISVLCLSFWAVTGLTVLKYYLKKHENNNRPYGQDTERR
jgi:hypothetical protein